ncbi:MAG: GTP-binding protein [Lachnospiraceae bacterium]|nr:GTP-binding protein [Lachnospiraceae bacterium]
MVTVDLITGFLGAGKTTFLRHYIPYLKSKGETLHIIENEFADCGIDSFLLHSEEDDCCEISDLSGMCMCCIGKREFIHLLLSAAQNGITRIIVEPSGIYDVDEFFDVLSDPRVSQCCEIGCIISIVDPLLSAELSEEAKYLTFSQLLASGTVIFSKTQLISENQLQVARDRINQLLSEKGCDSGLPGEVCTKPWDQLTESDFEDFMDSSYFRMVHDRESFEHSFIFQSKEIRLRDCTNKEDLRNRIQSLFTSPVSGRVFRVKGFASTADGKQYEVNATGSLISIEESKVQADTLVVIGQR